MLDTLNQWILVITRPVLDWMLYLPRDLTLFIVAIGTALILTGVRIFSTDQNRLKRCKQDKARLKALIREAKKRRDKEAVKRHQATIGQIGLVTMKAEGLPLLASLVPIALLAVWAFCSIAYLPPQDGDTLTVKMIFPKMDIGKVVHLLPQEGIKAVPPEEGELGIKPEDGWIQPIVKDYTPAPDAAEWKLLTDPQAMKAHLDQEAADAGKYEKEKAEAKKAGQPEPKAPKPKELPVVSNGLATWNLKCQKSDKEYLLRFRFDGREYVKPLRMDGVHYADPLGIYDDNTIFVETVLDEYKLFDVVPGIPMLMLQAWIVGYLCIVLPFSLILKPVLRIY